MTKPEEYHTVKEVDKIDKRIVNYDCTSSLEQAKRRAKKFGGTITNDEEEKNLLIRRFKTL
tara:strand:- start:276 stop:458 length:183 start_codon:yes stop_codon:yes gene_type:complete